jgi:hypothetical protein
MMRVFLVLVGLLAAQIPLQQAYAEPTTDQIDQDLHGLLPRDQDQTTAENLRRAYMRGYQRGLEDARSKQSQQKPKGK